MTEAVVNAVVTSATKAVASAAINYGIGLITKAIDDGLHDSTPDRRDPRISLEVVAQNSAYGVPMPVVYGINRIAGNIIWQVPGVTYTEERGSTTTSTGK